MGKKKENNSIRAAKIFGQRLRLPDENMAIRNSLAQLCMDKKKRLIDFEIETAQSKTRYC